MTRAKQDGTYTRTASDLERKYNFGQRFSEILGLIDDTRDKVDETASGLTNEITKQSTELRRSAEEIVAEAKKTITQETNGKINEINSEVEAKLNADAFSVYVKKEDLKKGISLDVGYTFDEEGLNISSSGSTIENLLTNQGMYVNRNGSNILTADSSGVTAVDLHAKTYLIIGSGKGRSRFEDYGADRTGCFWIGG